MRKILTLLVTTLLFSSPGERAYSKSKLKFTQHAPVMDAKGYENDRELANRDGCKTIYWVSKPNSKKKPPVVITYCK